MLTIGLTGGIGSGKSTAARFFAELNIPVIDADVIARELVAPKSEILKKITAHFGPNILDDAHQLRRDKLRELIFADSKERQWLENLLHPLIWEKMQQLAKTVNSPYCIMEIPLLLEKNLPVDRILVIDCSIDKQTERLKQQRVKMDIKLIKAILEIQLTREQRRASADDIIDNEGTLEELRQQVKNLHQKYLELGKS